MINLIEGVRASLVARDLTSALVVAFGLERGYPTRIMTSMSKCKAFASPCQPTTAGEHMIPGNTRSTFHLPPESCGTPLHRGAITCNHGQATSPIGSSLDFYLWTPILDAKLIMEDPTSLNGSCPGPESNGVAFDVAVGIRNAARLLMPCGPPAMQAGLAGLVVHPPLWNLFF
jgi:hypothetical protein